MLCPPSFFPSWSHFSTPLPVAPENTSQYITFAQTFISGPAYEEPKLRHNLLSLLLEQQSYINGASEAGSVLGDAYNVRVVAYWVAGKSLQKWRYTKKQTK